MRPCCLHPCCISYTPVCSTELGEAAVLDFEFRNRGVKIVGFSCSPAEEHKGWIRDIKQISGAAPSFPIFSDPTRQHAEALGVLDKRNRDRGGLPLTVRAVYILDPTKTIRLMTAYPASTGRNMDEILRSIDSLLLTDKHDIATPCNWKPGDDVIVDYNLSDQLAELQFDQYRIVDLPSEGHLQQPPSENGKTTDKKEDDTKHYLLYTKDPSLLKYESPL